MDATQTMLIAAWEAEADALETEARAFESDGKLLAAQGNIQKAMYKRNRAQALLSEGSVPRTKPVDCTSDVAAQLFAPFPPDVFPARLDRSKLHQVLNAPLSGKIPVPVLQYPDFKALHSDLYEPDDSRTAGGLAATLEVALKMPWPMGKPSEILYTYFWQSVGYALPEIAGTLLGFEAVVNRNVEDPSITLPDKKRDYMVHLKGRLVIGGEEKASSNQLRNAVNELCAKHKGANAAVYGGLRYLILIATAGERCAVYAMELGTNGTMTPIIEDFEIKSPLGRRKVVNLFINLSRWVRTVHELRLLPPTPPAPLAISFTRSSPYSEMGEVELTLYFNHVQKNFAVPSNHLPELVDVYFTLAELDMPGAIRCKSFKINEKVVDLKNKTMPTLPEGSSLRNVALKLWPVGAGFDIHDDSELMSLVASLLSTLRHLHEAGYVHRDIRMDNIVKYYEHWVLIDWELAGRADQKVWWDSKALPEPVRLHKQPYTVQTDLWQVGKLIMSQQASASPAAQLFAQQLVSYEFMSAAEAEGNLWSVT